MNLSPLAGRAYRFCAVLSFALALNGCATSIALDHNVAASIHKIVLAGPNEPKAYTAISGNIVIGMGVGVGVGVGIGGVSGNSLAAATLENAMRKGDFDAEMKLVNPDMAQFFRRVLSADLIKDGYSVTEQLSTSPIGDKPSFNTISNDSDAVLDVVIVPLYETDPLSSVYTPTVAVIATLYDRKTGRTIYRNYYNYGGHSKTNPSDPSHSFDGYQQLIVNPQRAAEYFRDGIPVLAEALARDLKIQ